MRRTHNIINNSSTQIQDGNRDTHRTGGVMMSGWRINDRALNSPSVKNNGAKKKREHTHYHAIVEEKGEQNKTTTTAPPTSVEAAL